MKFLVDAQLPARLARFLDDAGHDSVHTSQLAGGNRLSDWRLAEIADDEERVVVTKDRDFRDGHLLVASPRRLLIIATGNISNDALLALFGAHLVVIVDTFDDADFVEMSTTALTVHRRRN